MKLRPDLGLLLEQELVPCHNFFYKKECSKNDVFGLVSVYFFLTMSDLALYRRDDGNFDLAFDESKGDLLTTESLENSVVMSIGSYARERNLGNVANLKPTVGGWWGDALDAKGTLGGYLYEAFPGKLTDSTARSVEKLCSEALAWLIDDGVAKSVDCTAAIANQETMNVNITVKRPEGGDEAFLYELNWSATNGI